MQKLCDIDVKRYRFAMLVYQEVRVLDRNSSVTVEREAPALSTFGEGTF